MYPQTPRAGPVGGLKALKDLALILIGRIAKFWEAVAKIT